jgi:hypothetical protein
MTKQPVTLPLGSTIHEEHGKPVDGELNDQELDQTSGGTEQVLNIGSRSAGAGAGRITFNPF